ncbi:hypothetical protein S7711_02750 [Stachybotrys chartarum IBT 7711]|uniref:Helicase ATP-binding domain-containing protein n=1 Tax=Stachybotrys chartarum (strain CBS 109288 / IBT 7711) TaxID=1280523 RepID=A0A084ALV7_STACB|nr:hypothetical protein S7711_02750 [Stachybotrys chartarum IBT 7711]
MGVVGTPNDILAEDQSDGHNTVTNDYVIVNYTDALLPHQLGDSCASSDELTLDNKANIIITDQISHQQTSVQESPRRWDNTGNRAGTETIAHVEAGFGSHPHTSDKERKSRLSDDAEEDENLFICDYPSPGLQAAAPPITPDINEQTDSANKDAMDVDDKASSNEVSPMTPDFSQWKATLGTHLSSVSIPMHDKKHCLTYDALTPNDGMRLSMPTPKEEDAKGRDNSHSVFVCNNETSAPGQNAEPVPDVPKKPRKTSRRAKNARDYIAQHYGNDHEAKEGKRKRVQEAQSSRKLSKLNNEPRSSLFATIHEMANDVTIGSAARTASLDDPLISTSHKTAEEIMRSDVPEGFDTRRKSTQEKDTKEAKSLFGYKQVQALTRSDGTLAWQLKNMSSALESYQLTAAAWMAKRELLPNPPFGGILADVMGMGKTVIALACVSGNLPNEELTKRFSCATLVVVPNKMIAEQWKSEIFKHCREPIRSSAAIYSSHLKMRPSYYKRLQIVITTFSEVRRQGLSQEDLQELRDIHKGDLKSFRKASGNQLGDLFQIDWYRVILDEAHAIKNHTGQTTIACQLLSANYRWLLTGTPLHNEREEIFPYLKFLGCEDTECRKDFIETYIKVQGDGEKFDSLISRIMLRRTHADTWGQKKPKAILSLPPSKTQDIWVPLSVEDQAFFDLVFKYYKRRCVGGKREEPELGPSNQDDSESTLRHAMNTRLRQIVSHPFNVERFLRTSLHEHDIDSLLKKLDEVAGKKTILQQLVAGIKDEDFNKTYQVGLNTLHQCTLRDGHAFGGLFNLKYLLQLIRNELSIAGEACGICKKPPALPVRAYRCDHVFCEKCILSTIEDSIKEHRIGSAICTVDNCNTLLDVGEDVVTLTSLEDEASTKEFTKPGKDANGVRLAREKDVNGLFCAALREPEANLIPCTKLTATMAVILTWMEEYPTDKIIGKNGFADSLTCELHTDRPVFTQFVETGEILGYLLGELGIEFYYMFGSVTHEQRLRALEKFGRGKKSKVLVRCPKSLSRSPTATHLLLIGYKISSLKCGGQSLNLTAANRVIIIDPWWNDTAETQAFGRVLRRGQEKATHLVRILSEGTFDTHVTDLQVKKAKDISAALQDDAPALGPGVAAPRSTRGRTREETKRLKEQLRAKARAAS